MESSCDLNDFYEVDKLVDVKMQNKKIYYLVKWKYYEEPTWEPVEHLKYDPTLIRNFQK